VLFQGLVGGHQLHVPLGHLLVLPLHHLELLLAGVVPLLVVPDLRLLILHVLLQHRNLHPILLENAVAEVAEERDVLFEELLDDALAALAPIKDWLQLQRQLQIVLHQYLELLFALFEEGQDGLVRFPLAGAAHQDPSTHLLQLLLVLESPFLLDQRPNIHLFRKNEGGHLVHELLYLHNDLVASHPLMPAFLHNLLKLFLLEA